MHTTWKNKMVEQYFNFTNSTVKEMTDFYETRAESLDHKEDKKMSFASLKKRSQGKKSNNNKKRVDPDSRVEHSSENHP